MRKFGDLAAVAAVAASIFASVPAAAEMEPATPESQGVSSEAILDWIGKCERDIDALHGFVIVRHGKVVAEGSWKPFDTLNEPHKLYSHSKNFTATAIGFLFDDGKINLDERVADIFADKLPPEPSENLRQVRVRDLLTMTYGAPRDHTLKSRESGEEWVKLVLAKKIENLPGTVFNYDSDATYLLAAIVERRAGKPMMDFLRERLFDPVGIGPVSSGMSPEGIPCGGWGMRMTTRDIARFGQLYLQKGVWEGRRIISANWVKLASSFHSCRKASGKKSNPDWLVGYGFQFWLCRHDAYRCDGSQGQFTIIMPDLDTVVSIHAGVKNMQEELSTVWDRLLPGIAESPLPENPEALARLRAKCASLELPTIDGAGPDGSSAEPIEAAVPEDAYFHGRLSKAIPSGSVSLRERDGGWEISFESETGRHAIPVGYREWRKGMIRYSNDNIEPIYVFAGEEPVAFSGAWTAPGKFTLRMYLTSAPEHKDIVFDFAKKAK